MVKISIIIPSRISSFDKIQKFKKVISSLQNQTLSKELYEIIIVDDGSDVNLKYELKDFIDKKWRIAFLQQEKKGPAAARNLGIKKANGEILFFLGDDTIAESNLLEEHLRMHQRYNNCAVTNPIEPPENLDKFNRLIIGNYDEDIEEDIERRISNKLGFCTACVSLNKKWLDGELFDESFKDPAFEDTELGIRLDRKGLKIVFTSKTRVCHEHIYNIQSMCERSRNIGRASVYLKKKHPVSNIKIKGTSSGFGYNIKKIVYSLLYKFISKIPAKNLSKTCIRIICGYNNILGIEEGKRLWGGKT